jgi:quinol monooxygenase YgiN
LVIFHGKRGMTMYGTIARFHLKPGKEAELADLLQELKEEDIPGAISEYVYRMDENPNEYYLAIIFEDKDQYMANADSPEQDARYRKFRNLLEEDPDWHDGEIAYSASWHLSEIKKTEVA